MKFLKLEEVLHDILFGFGISEKLVD